MDLKSLTLVRQKERKKERKKEIKKERKQKWYQFKNAQGGIYCVFNALKQNNALNLL